LRSSKVHNEIHKPLRKLRIWLASFTSRTNQWLCLQIGLWIPIWASKLRNEVRNICGQNFVKSTVKSSPGWGIFHSQLAQGPCISLQVVSRHPGIYTIITNQIKCSGVFPGGGGDGYSWNWLMHYSRFKIEVSVCQIFPRTQEIPYAARLCSDFCLIYCRLLLPIRNVLAQSHSWKHRSDHRAIAEISVAKCRWNWLEITDVVRWYIRVNGGKFRKIGGEQGRWRPHGHNRRNYNFWQERNYFVLAWSTLFFPFGLFGLSILLVRNHGGWRQVFR
jgi:hypothetical protein